MQTTLDLLGKPLRVELSDMAGQAMKQLEGPLHIEMELYFSCLIRKRVRFNVPVHGETVALRDGVTIGFRPVMTRGCAISEYTPESLEDLPITEPARFMPHWLRLDYRNGTWQGEFGF